MTNFSIEVSDQEPFERALRRFSIKTKKSGILREVKKKRFFLKPSVQKKMDRLKNIRRQKKAETLAQMTPSERAKMAQNKKTKGRTRPGSGPGR